MAHYVLRLIGDDGRPLARLHFSGRSLADVMESAGEMQSAAQVELWCAGLKIRTWGSASGRFLTAVGRALY